MTAVEGEQTSPPTPPPVSGEEFDNYGLNHSLWDTLAVYGPLTWDESRDRWQQTSYNYREFIRHHPEHAGDTSVRVTVMADRWMHDRVVERCLRNGWVVEEDERLAAGHLPPEHVPLSTMGGEMGVRRRLDAEVEAEALTFLLRKAKVARRHLRRNAVAMLAESIRDTPEGRSPTGTGQQQPILMYRPQPRERPKAEVNNADYRIVVDGYTRLAACEQLGVKPWMEDLPPTVTAADALLIRVAMETHGSMKSETPEEYVARLTQAGLSGRRVAEATGLSHKRVRTILGNCALGGTVAKRSPDAAEVARMVNLRDQGYTQADIGGELGRPRRTIAYHLAQHDAAQPDAEVIPLRPEQEKPKRKRTKVDDIKSNTTAMSTAIKTSPKAAEAARRAVRERDAAADLQQRQDAVQAQADVWCRDPDPGIQAVGLAARAAMGWTR